MFFPRVHLALSPQSDLYIHIDIVARIGYTLLSHYIPPYINTSLLFMNPSCWVLLPYYRHDASVSG